METWVLNVDVMCVYVAGGDGPVLSLVVLYKFQTENDKMKLLTEYESATQKVVLTKENCLRNIKV
jgi:hypothetical protein